MRLRAFILFTLARLRERAELSVAGPLLGFVWTD